MRNEQEAKTLVPLIIQSLHLADSGNWTCKSGELNATIDIIVGGRLLSSLFHLFCCDDDDGIHKPTTTNSMVCDILC